MYEIFRRLCEDRGITTYRFCKDTGINASTISTWKNRNTTCNLKLATTIAEYFGVSVDYVMTGQEPQSTTLTNIFPIELKRFPMLGKIACGVPKYTNEDRESYVMRGWEDSDRKKFPGEIISGAFFTVSQCIPHLQSRNIFRRSGCNTSPIHPWLSGCSS